LRSINLLIQFGIRRNCLRSGRSLSLYVCIRRARKQTVVIIGAYQFCQLHTNFYLASCCQGKFHSLGPRKNILLRKLIALHLVKELPTSYGIHRLISPIYRSPQTNRILSKLNSGHALTSHFFHMHLNVAFHLFLVLTGSPIPSALSLQLYYVSYRICFLRGSVFIRLIRALISIAIFGEECSS